MNNTEYRNFIKCVSSLNATGVVDSLYREKFSHDLSKMLEMAIEYDDEYWDDKEDAEYADYYRHRHPFHDEIISYISDGIKLEFCELFANEIHQLIEILDGGDMDDAFGTEGWMHQVWG